MTALKGKVASICISTEKGSKKGEVAFARLISGRGIEGDAHAGPGLRQVSLLAAEDIESLKQFIPGLKPGDFAENIVSRGIGLGQIRIGDRIRIGEEVILEVSQIGKKCHSGCEIQKLTGDCIMPKKGIFTKVLKGGLVEKNDIVKLRKMRNPNHEETDSDSKAK